MSYHSSRPSIDGWKRVDGYNKAENGHEGEGDVKGDHLPRNDVFVVVFKELGAIGHELTLVDRLKLLVVIHPVVRSVECNCLLGLNQKELVLG